MTNAEYLSILNTLKMQLKTQLALLYQLNPDYDDIVYVKSNNRYKEVVKLGDDLLHRIDAGELALNDIFIVNTTGTNT